MVSDSPVTSRCARRTELGLRVGGGLGAVVAEDVGQYRQGCRLGLLGRVAAVFEDFTTSVEPAQARPCRDARQRTARLLRVIAVHGGGAQVAAVPAQVLAARRG